MICPGYCVLLSERKRKQGCSRYASFFTAPRVPPAHLPAQAWEQGAENKEQRADGSQPPDTNRCPIPDSGEQMARAARILLELRARLDECALGGMAPHVAGRDGSARSWEGWLRRYPVSSVPTTSIRGDCDPSDLLRSACGVIPHREVVPAVSTHTPLTAGTSIRSAAAVVGCHRGREIPVTTW